MILPVGTPITDTGRAWLFFLRLLAVICVALQGLRLAAATNFVVASENLQARILAAAPGDTLVVQGGIYPGNLRIPKPLSLVGSGGAWVESPNRLTIETAGTVLLSKFLLGDLVTTVSNSNLRLIDCSISGDVGHAGGKVLLKRCQIGGTLNLTNSSLDALRLTNQGRIHLIGTFMERLPQAVFAQSHSRSLLIAERYQLITGHLFTQGLQLKEVRSKHIGLKVFMTSEDLRWFGDWFGNTEVNSTPGNYYNEKATLNTLSSCVRIDQGDHLFLNSECVNSTHTRIDEKQTIVQNSRNNGDRSREIPSLRQPVAVMARNAQIHLENCNLVSWGLVGWKALIPINFMDQLDFRGRNSITPSPRSVGVAVQGGSLVLDNCYLQLQSESAQDDDGSLVAVLGDSKPAVTFRNSLVYGTTWDPAEGTAIRTTAIRATLVEGDARVWPTNVRLASRPPVSVTWSDAWGFTTTLIKGSALLNAGSDDPLKKNTDGTRNTIGATGGPMYNPGNATTDRPMAFWLGLLPQRVVRGFNDTVDLDAAAAAGH
jgi:hypothetical protein